MFSYFICSYALFDMDGNQVAQELVTKVGESFESILKEASNLFFWIMSSHILYNRAVLVGTLKFEHCFLL